MKHIRQHCFFLIITAFIVLLMTGQAYSARFGFEGISKNYESSTAVGESQLFMDVESEGTDRISFTFRNIGAELSSITDIYFYDSLASSVSLTLTDADYEFSYVGDVLFSSPATPDNLPSLNHQNLTLDFSADSESSAGGVQPSGINPGESLGITFKLASISSRMGSNFDDVIANLENKRLIVGLKVQGITANDYSESFINNSNPVPEPTTLLLLGPGLIGLARLRKRFHKIKSHGSQFA